MNQSKHDRALNVAEDAERQAIWYAFGRLDQWRETNRDIPGIGSAIDAFQFGKRVKQIRYDFEIEKTFHMKSVQDLWKEYVEEISSL